MPTWDAGGDGVTWESDANWGGATYPQTSSDQAIFPNGFSSAVTTSTILTIGDLDLQSGFSGSITLGANLTVDDIGTQNGRVKITEGTLDLNGNQLSLDGDFIKTGGTFDAADTGSKLLFLGTLDPAVFTINDNLTIYDLEINRSHDTDLNVKYIDLIIASKD